jgi:hypothetical protein
VVFTADQPWTGTDNLVPTGVSTPNRPAPIEYMYKVYKVQIWFRGRHGPRAVETFVTFTFKMFIPCIVTTLETYITPTNALFDICSYNLLHSSYMCRRYITPSSGTCNQSLQERPVYWKGGDVTQGSGKGLWVGFRYTLRPKEPSGLLQMLMSRKGRWPSFSVSTVN